MELAKLAQSGIPWSVELGCGLIEMGGGIGRVEMPWRADLVAFDHGDSITTGAIAALMDHCCGMAVLSSLDRPAGISTLNLKIDHFRPSNPGSALIAEARCFRRTTMMAFVRVDVWDHDPANLGARR